MSSIGGTTPFHQPAPSVRTGCWGAPTDNAVRFASRETFDRTGSSNSDYGTPRVTRGTGPSAKGVNRVGQAFFRNHPNSPDPYGPLPLIPDEARDNDIPIHNDERLPMQPHRVTGVQTDTVALPEENNTPINANLSDITATKNSIITLKQQLSSRGIFSVIFSVIFSGGINDQLKAARAKLEGQIVAYINTVAERTETGNVSIEGYRKSLEHVMGLAKSGGVNKSARIEKAINNNSKCGKRGLANYCHKQLGTALSELGEVLTGIRVGTYVSDESLKKFSNRLEKVKAILPQLVDDVARASVNARYNELESMIEDAKVRNRPLTHQTSPVDQDSPLQEGMSPRLLRRHHYPLPRTPPLTPSPNPSPDPFPRPLPPTPLLTPPETPNPHKTNNSSDDVFYTW